MAGGAAEIHQPALGQHDQPLAVGKDDLVDLRLDFLAPGDRRLSIRGLALLRRAFFDAIVISPR